MKIEKKAEQQSSTICSSESKIREQTKEPELLNESLKREIAERKLAEDVLKKSNQLLRDTGEMAKVGGWEFDIKTLEQVWTEEVYRIHEVDMTYKPTVTGGIDFHTPASRPIIERAVKRAVEYGEPFDMELEFITAKGNLRWVHSIGKADREHGKVSGTFQDITQRKQKVLDAGVKGLMQKPFRIEEVTKTIADTIAQKSGK